LQERIKLRNGYLNDFDSYRRRMKDAGDAAKAAKLQSKLDAASSTVYNRFNLCGTLTCIQI
jgi:hypothetical protein